MPIQKPRRLSAIVAADTAAVNLARNDLRRLSLMNFSKAAAAIALVASFAAPAVAVPIQGTGSTGVTFMGDISFDAATNDLTVSLSNTSSAVTGGYITAFAFDVASNATLSLVSSPNTSFDNLLSGVRVAPFGDREWGASTHSDRWLGGGSPKVGLGVGQSGTWVFDVSPDSTASLDVSGFVVRYRGLADGGSDKVHTGTTPPIPEPETYALMLAGLGAVGFMARRRRKV